MKECKTCKKILPENEFYFTKRNGYDLKCKECTLNHKLTLHPKNPNGDKKCLTCNEVLLNNKFYYTSRDGYLNICIECYKQNRNKELDRLIGECARCKIIKTLKGNEKFCIDCKKLIRTEKFFEKLQSKRPCSNCKIIKSVVDCFYINFDKQTVSILCKECDNSTDINLYNKHFEEHKHLIIKELKESFCIVCGITHSITEFYIDKYGDPHSYCKSQAKKIDLQKYYNNKEIKKIENLKNENELYLINPTKICNGCEIEKDKKINFVVLHNGKFSKYCNACDLELKEFRRYKTKDNLEYIKNKEEIIKHQTERDHKRYNEDIVFKLKKDVSKEIRRRLKNQGVKQTDVAINYLPYTIQELKDSISSKFEPWMKWNNWGQYRRDRWDDNDKSTWKWNLDHIIPQSDLPFTSFTDENFIKCWSLENLRPLNAKQNILDGTRRTRHIKQIKENNGL